LVKVPNQLTNQFKAGETPIHAPRRRTKQENLPIWPPQYPFYTDYQAGKL